ncbi:glycoside hydrolase family 9 protein [Jiulongibacter sediminis]|uniref:Glycoside hydrolase family 9 n=1 Tax=Jiulongibacter sediminis TaxID=1605367 RepID=A0A0P7C786_9BACT|nr:glycoside hydrolase family 9 protein [Jiulongibacter sediminis]KPM49351.1 glycoside hydrolase family 9 [Jiulongibacter sediminis]
MKYRYSVLSLLCFFIAIRSDAQEFRINLAGYLPDGSKKVLFLDSEFSTERRFVLKSVADSRFELKLKAYSKTNWKPFERTFEIHFDEFQNGGEYFIQELNSGLQSKPFTIGLFPDWQEDVIGFMQTQRCGFNPYFGDSCHKRDGLSFYGLVPDSSLVDAGGGWHDAGDQLKYLITGSNATARMLQAWLKYPNQFKDRVLSNGLKGENGLPDVLDEARWGLEWLLRLHPQKEVLYHQVADDRDHHGFKMPQNDNADYGWGANGYRPVYAATGRPQGLGKYKSKATGYANLAGRTAAALALGFQAFEQFDETRIFAKRCLLAALEVYQLGKENEGFQQGNSYGAPYRYEENTWADDMEWAAAELYKVTNQKTYLKDARKYAEEIGNWSWMQRDTASHYEMYPFVNMGHYAFWQTGNRKDKKRAAEYYRQNLKKVQERAAGNPYGVGHLFIWCSNNLSAAVATQAILYEEMTGDTQFRQLIFNQINWIFGLNPWGTSMITGLPENADWPLDVHMPFRVLNKQVVKGSLVDGPLWSTIHDGMLGIQLSEEDEYKDYQPPHIRYHDDYADYSTNEPTMDGSADLILLLTYLNTGR